MKYKYKLDPPKNKLIVNAKLAALMQAVIDGRIKYKSPANIRDTFGWMLDDQFVDHFKKRQLDTLVRHDYIDKDKVITITELGNKKLSAYAALHEVGDVQ